MGYFLKRTNIDHQGLVLPSGPTSDRPASPILASARYNTDTDSIEYFNGSAYVDIAKTGRADVKYDKFLGNGSDTIFGPMSIEHTNWQDVLVFIDGLLQIGLGHYDVSGFNITFTEAVPNGMRIVVIHGVGSTYVPSSNIFDVPNL